MDNATYMANLVKIAADLKAIIASDHAMTGQILNDALKLLSKVNTQTRKLTREAKALEVVRKGAK